MPNSVTSKWVTRLRDFVPGFIAGDRGLGLLEPCSAIVLHGSTTFGVDDACSDLDLWVLAPQDAVERFDQLSPSRFVEFKLEGKKGHFNVEPLEAFSERMRRCYFPLIAELREAVILRDFLTGQGMTLIEQARRPMTEAVRRAWFCYHYVEMRGEHRACDNPIDRGDATALLIAIGKTVEHALQAASILDGQPYHYSKWLSRMARRARTGAAVAERVDELIDLVGTGAIKQPGPEKDHPVSLKLREIRTVLVNAARAGGIDEPWLTEWWLYIDKARSGVEGVAWASCP